MSDKFPTECPNCAVRFQARAEVRGRTVACPKCKHKFIVRDTTGQTKRAETSGLVDSPPREISTNVDVPILVQVVDVEKKTASVVADVAWGAFLNEDQDPTVVQAVYQRAKEFMTPGETINYIAVQKKPVMTFLPQSIALTSKRFVVFRPKLGGGLSFEDHHWRLLFDAKIDEGIFGSTLSFAHARGGRLSIDYLPKAQARRLYRICQEMEELALEERRQREMEERRAAAGGVFINSSVAAQPQPADTQPNAVSRLKQLKEMLDAGLIDKHEFEVKKAEILSRM